MRIADHPKKLGLLLLPLIPLSAIGIVEVVHMASGANETCACAPAPVAEHCQSDLAPPPPAPLRLHNGPDVSPPA